MSFPVQPINASLAAPSSYGGLQSNGNSSSSSVTTPAICTSFQRRSCSRGLSAPFARSVTSIARPRPVTSSCSNRLASTILPGLCGRAALPRAQTAATPAATTAAADNSRLSSAASRSSHVAGAQRRRLFGEGGSSADGGGSSSSDDEAQPVRQPPSQQQLAAAAEAERARKRMDALRRMQAAKAQLRKMSARGVATGSVTMDAALQQLLAREVAADAADIVASSPATLRRQLAQEGADLEADWAEAEAAGAGTLTTTGRAKSLAALAAAKGLSPSDMLRPTRPFMRPERMPYPDSGAGSYDDDYGDDEDDNDWLEILDSDDLPYWDDTSSSSQQGFGGQDPTAVAAAAIRRQMNDPGFNAWLQQQEQQREAKEARARREAELQAKLQAGAPAAQRLRLQQEAADLARLQSQLRQQQQQGVMRPLMRPNAAPNSSGGAAANGWDDNDVIADPSAVRKSDVGLTPAQMAALLDEIEAAEGGSSSRGSSGSRGLQAPVFTPKQGYSFSGEARATSSRLAAAAASGQLQKPLLVRPAVRPAGTAGSNPLLDQQAAFWDESEAAAAAAAQEQAQRKALIQSLLAEQEQREQQQQQQQRRQQQQQGSGLPSPERVAAAANNLKKAVLNAQLKRPARPGAPAAAANQSTSAPTAAAASAAGALQRPLQPSQQQQQQQQEEVAWDAEEAAAAAVAKQEAARLALVQQLQAEADAAEDVQLSADDMAWFEQAAGASAPAAAAAAVPAVPRAATGPVAAKPALQNLRKPQIRPGQQQQLQQQQLQQQQLQQQQQQQKAAARASPTAAPRAKAQAATAAARKLQQPALNKPQRPQDQPAVEQQQDGEAWDAEDAAELKAAQAAAARCELLQQLAAEAAAAEAAAADAAGAAAAAGEALGQTSKAVSSSSSKAQKVDPPAVDGEPLKKLSQAFSGLKKPPARPAPQPPAAAAAKAKDSSSPKQPHKAPQQQQQQAKKQGRGAKGQQPAQSKQQTADEQQAPEGADTAATAEAAAAAAAAAAEPASDVPAAAADAAGQRSKQQQQRVGVQGSEGEVDRAALRQRLEQAAKALQPTTSPQLQRPAKPPVLPPAAAAAGTSKGETARANGSSSSSSSAPKLNSTRRSDRVEIKLQHQQQQQQSIEAAAVEPAVAAEEAVDWRFATSSSSSRRSAGVRAERERLPRFIPDDKLQLAHELELTRTPTTAVIRGVALDARRGLSLVLQLDQLGCVTLMPVAQLLPSQVVQLFAEAGMGVPSFMFQGRELRDTGFAGVHALPVLQGWKGRKLDVIIAVVPQPSYAVFSARERATAAAPQQPQLRRFSRAFWAHLALLQQLVGDRSYTLQRAADTMDAVYEQRADDAVQDPTSAPSEEEKALALTVVTGLQGCPPPAEVDREALADARKPEVPVLVRVLRQHLCDLAAKQALPADVAGLLLEPAGAAGEHKYARCVAVATWPPAWLDQQQQQQQGEEAAAAGGMGQGAAEAAAAAVTSSSGSASASSGGGGGRDSSQLAVWVADPNELEAVAEGSDLPPYSGAQTLLWTIDSDRWDAQREEAAEGRLGESPEYSLAVRGHLYDAQVVGVHPQGYLICQVMSSLTFPEPPIEAAAVAVPLAMCPPSMRLQQPAAAGGARQAAAEDADGLPLWQAQEQPRWEPWNLGLAGKEAGEEAGGGAAAGAERTEPSSSKQQRGAAGVLGPAELQSWRQGVLGMFRQPHLKVRLQLLPLEQQQDPAALQAACDRHEGEELADLGLDRAALEGLLDMSQVDFSQSEWGPAVVVHGRTPPTRFGAGLNLLLLGSIPQQEEGEE